MPVGNIPEENCELWFSGGVSNKDPDKALGGAFGDFTLNKLWHDDGILLAPFTSLSEAERAAGLTDYRCVFLRNNDSVNTWGNPEVFFEDPESYNAGIVMSAGVCVEGKNSAVELLANKTTPPTSVTFHPATVGSPLAIGVDLDPGDYIGVWLRRAYPAGGIASEDWVVFWGMGDVSTRREWKLRWGVNQDLAAGPMLQWTRDRSARVWFKLAAAGTAEVRIGSRSWSETVAAWPYTGFILVDDLEPETKYTYSYWVNGVEQIGGPWSFVTMPVEGSPGRFLLVFLSDHHDTPAPLGTADDDMEAYYATLLEHVTPLDTLPKLCIINGDYEIPGFRDTGSHTLDRRVTSLTVNRLRGVAGGGPSNRSRFHASVPTYYAWDDWDFLGNNSASEEFNYYIGEDVVTIPLRTRADMVRVAIDAARLMWAGSPFRSGTGIESVFQVADVPFVLLDARSRRTQTPATAAGIIVQTQRAVTPWDPEAAEFLGADQLAWLEGQLEKYEASPLKFLVAGDNWIDNVAETTPLSGQRDSVGLWHRGERNKFLAWLRDHPDANRGLVNLKGDDHTAMIHRSRRWRAPDPFVGGAVPPHTATPDPETEVLELGEVLQIAGNVEGGAGAIISAPWRGHPDEVLWIPGVPLFWSVLVDTRGTPRATFTLRTGDTGQVRYQFEMIDGQFFFPQTLHHSTPVAVPMGPSTYAEDASPSSVWTEDPAPP